MYFSADHFPDVGGFPYERPGKFQETRSLGSFQGQQATGVLISFPRKVQQVQSHPSPRLQPLAKYPDQPQEQRFCFASCSSLVGRSLTSSRHCAGVPPATEALTLGKPWHVHSSIAHIVPVTLALLIPLPPGSSSQAPPPVFQDVCSWHVERGCVQRVQDSEFP